MSKELIYQFTVFQFFKLVTGLLSLAVLLLFVVLLFVFWKKSRGKRKAIVIIPAAVLASMTVVWFGFVSGHIASGVALVGEEYLTTTGEVKKIEADGILISSLTIGREEVFRFSRTKFHCLRPRLVGGHPYSMGNHLEIYYYEESDGNRCIVKLYQKK